jgi:isoleucyl-tRNA synthetase
MICHVDLAGKFTEKVVEVVGEEHGRKLVGLEVLNEGGMQIVEILRSKVDFGAGRLIKEEKIKHRYPYDWRTGKPVIVLSVSSQVIMTWSLILVACSGQLSSGLRTSKV